MMSQESGDGQHASPPGPPSPGQQHQQLLLHDEQGEISTPLPPSHADAHVLAPAPAHTDTDADADAIANTEASCRAIRSSFPSQNGESGIDAAKGSDSPASGDKHFKAAWKDEWVVSLIHLRGAMDDEFMKPQKSGLDLWTRVCMGMTEAHEDFDKNSESCRKKWQRVYKMFKDSKASLATADMEEKQMPCKWFDLIEHYMRRHFDCNGHPIGSDEPLASAEGAAHADSGLTADIIAHHIKVNAKRARRDQEIKETLSKMVVTWRESLEVLKDSEAKRLEILQKMSSTMAGLLDTLRK